MSTTHGTWLAAPEDRALTPYRNDAGAWPLLLVVVHFTATPHSGARPDERGSNRERQMAWLQGRGRESSTHLDVLRGGRLLQGAPLDTARAWHAGGSKWTAPDGQRPKYINRVSIGLDLDNVGALYETPGGLVDSYEWDRMYTAPGEAKPNRRRPPVHQARTFHTGPAWRDPRTGRWWEAYTAPQMATCLRTVVALRDLYPQLRDPRRWVGHEAIRSTKEDPGPAFPWAWLQAALQPGFEASTVDLIDWAVVAGCIA